MPKERDNDNYSDSSTRDQKALALAQALSDANDEASHFLGDWHVTVERVGQ